MLSTLTKANLYLNYFGLMKVPLIWYCRPKVMSLNQQTVVVKIPFRRRNKNHLNSLYFGVMAVGADVAGGFMAMHKAQQRGGHVSLAFKAVKAEFLKRPQADVYFRCDEGEAIDAMLDETFHTGERVNKAVRIVATCPSLHGDEPMAEFWLTLSLKYTKA